MGQGASAVGGGWRLYSHQDPGGCWMYFPGILVKSPLQKSSLEEIEAQTSFSASRLKWAEPGNEEDGGTGSHRCLIWSLKVGWGSNRTPRFVTEEERGTIWPSKESLDMGED